MFRPYLKRGKYGHKNKMFKFFENLYRYFHMYVKNVKTVSGGSVGRACQYDHIVKMYHIFSVSPVGGV